MMSRAQVVTMYISVSLTALTGIVFAWMKYFMKSDDPFAVANHPMQPYMLAAHVVVAPVLVFAFGWIFGNHVVAGLTNPAVPKRTSGVVNVLVALPMIASGYLLQIATADATRKAMAVAHWVSSGFFVVAFVAHTAGAVIQRRRGKQ